MKTRPDPHFRHRFLAEIISHAVWLCHLFSLSLPDVELILAERGVVQPRRDTNAAKRFVKRLLKVLQYVPRVLVTDKLRSYGVVQRQLLAGVEHRQSRISK